MRVACHSRLRRFVAATLLSSTMFVAGSAQAQTAAAEDYASDEIIVTAQKREESLQRVPISMVALGTAALEKYNVTNLNDYMKLLPSVAIQTSGPGSGRIYFRGVASGGDGNHSGSLPSVGVYLDEQPVTTTIGSLDVHIYDIARIEALSGPQGTLYGASSQAGTLRIITNKPVIGKVDAGVDAEVNHIKHGDFGGKLEGFVNLPINDMMAARVVGWYQRDGGYIDNVPATRTFGSGITINNAATVEKNYNDTDTYGGRAALRVELDDNWTVTPTFMAQEQKSRGFYGYWPSTGDLQIEHFGEEGAKDRFWQAAATIQGKIADFDITYSAAFLKRKVDTESDYTDYTVTYDINYGGAFSQYFTDNSGAFINPAQHISGKDYFTKHSQELRVSSPQENRFRVIGGLFFQRQRHMILQDYAIAGLADATSVPGNPGTLWLTDQVRIDKDYAAFGEASFDITDKLTITGGLRFFKYNNSLIGFYGFGTGFSGSTGVGSCYTDNGQPLRLNPTGTLLGAVTPRAPCTNLAVYNADGTLSPKRSKGDGKTHRLNLTFKPSEDVLLYGTWSRGFRPGGINRRDPLPPYEPDYLTNYELGFKSTLFDRKLRLNAAIYMQDWKAFQFAFLGLNSLTQIQNGSNARIKGFEFDFTYRPVPQLTITGSGSYNDAKLRKNVCSAADPTFQCTDPGNFITAAKGTSLPVTPKFKGSGSVRYDFDLGERNSYVQGVVTRAGTARAALKDADQATLGNLKAYTTFDFSAGTQIGPVSATLFLENAFDKRAEISRSVACSVCTTTAVFVLRPQTIGLHLGWKY